MHCGWISTKQIPEVRLVFVPFTFYFLLVLILKLYVWNIVKSSTSECWDWMSLVMCFLSFHRCSNNSLCIGLCDHCIPLMHSLFCWTKFWLPLAWNCRCKKYWRYSISNVKQLQHFALAFSVQCQRALFAISGQWTLVVHLSPLSSYWCFSMV